MALCRLICAASLSLYAIVLLIVRMVSTASEVRPPGARAASPDPSHFLLLALLFFEVRRRSYLIASSADVPFVIGSFWHWLCRRDSLTASALSCRCLCRCCRRSHRQRHQPCHGITAAPCVALGAACPPHVLSFTDNCVRFRSLCSLASSRLPCSQSRSVPSSRCAEAIATPPPTPANRQNGCSQNH